jgi:hypothetical protein
MLNGYTLATPWWWLRSPEQCSEIMLLCLGPSIRLDILAVVINRDYIPVDLRRMITPILKERNCSFYFLTRLTDLYESTFSLQNTGLCN